jgi:hypothetical protein
MAKQMNVEQAFRIKRLLAERRLSITALALKLGEAYGSVANTIYGHRSNRQLQDKIAGFLGLPVEELFRESMRSPGETLGPLDACATADACGTEACGTTIKGKVSHG